MKLKYTAQKRTRIKYNCMGMTTFENGWWYNTDLQAWFYNPEHGTSNFSSHQPCRSVRAFRRKLKLAPKGVVFLLCSRWQKHEIYGKGQAKYTKLYE